MCPQVSTTAGIDRPVEGGGEHIETVQRSSPLQPCPIAIRLPGPT